MSLLEASKAEKLQKRKGKISSVYKNLSKGKKALVFVVIIVCLAGIGGGVYSVVKPEPPIEVSVVEVSTGDIQQTITETGTVRSTSQSNFKAVNGVMVKEVHVKVGDTVSPGSPLASFDLTGLSENLEQKKQAYTQSLKTYEESLIQAKKAAEQLPQVQAQIEALQNNASEDTAFDLSKITELISDFSLEKAVNLLSNLASGLNVASLLGGSSYSNEEMELIELQAKKIVLESQASNTMSDVYKKLVDSTKKEADAYQQAYDGLKEGWVAQKDGVVTAVNLTAGQSFNVSDASTQADFSSLLSQLQSGVDVTSLLSSFSTDVADGLVIDNYEGFIVDFTISQYDMAKVNIDQVVSVSAVNNPNSYIGKVSYISPTMSEASMSLDINSIASSLTGGSSSGLQAKAVIENPDRSLVIGMNVDIVINTSFVPQTMCVPIEAMYLEGNDSYVFVIDGKKVHKKPLEVGINSDTMYEVKSGCEVGDKLVKNPTPKLQEGTRIKIKPEKS